MSITAAQVKELRERTGAGMMDCKKALEETNGDMDAAAELLRVRLGDKALKMGGREATEGTVASYIHGGGKVGVLVEVDCNTDFVARNEDFQAFAREIAMHIAASPTTQYVSEDDIPQDAKDAELRVFEQQAADKPENVRAQDRRGQAAQVDGGGRAAQPAAREPGQARRQDDRAAARGALGHDGRERRDPALRPLPGRGVTDKPAFQRVLVKLSGEALMGDLEFGTDAGTVEAIAKQLKGVRDRGVEVSVVLGAGNIYRGLKGAAAGMDRATADYMGMLAIVLNALTLQDALEKDGVYTRVMSALTISEVAEPYIRRRAMRHLEKGRIVIFAAGTGNPFFTSDTAAALRALEMHAEIILMAKNGVEGVYTADPKKDPDAEFIPEIAAREAIARDLKVMDVTALSLCMENKLPINVFNMNDERNIDRIVSGERVGTLVKPE